MNDFELKNPALNMSIGEFMANKFGKGKKSLLTENLKNPAIPQSAGDVIRVGLNASGSVPKTLLVQDLEPQPTLINPETGMAQDYQPAGSGGPDLASLAMASKRSVPAMSAGELEKALQARRNWGYSMAKALAGLPQQEGYGSWLGNFGKAFGSAFMAPTDAWVNKELTLAKEARDAAKAYKDEDDNALIMSLLLGN